MSLLTVYWLARTFCAKAQVADGRPERAGNVVRTTICEVVSNPGSFDGKIIELRADVFAGLESNILYDKNCGLREQLPARILFIESTDVPRTSEYKKFWNLVQAYKEPEGKRRSIVPDKYTVTATLIGRFDAASPSRPEIGPCGQLVLKSVRDVIARPFDASFLARTNKGSSAMTVMRHEAGHAQGREPEK
jgi:hypothetical protein